MSGDASKGWVLHSLAQGRKFGPMTEDELRNYFRAGMVKSVDRLTAPGDFALRSAAEVATMLGETVPAGPPPPEITEAPTPLPSMAARIAPDPAAEARAAKALAAMNIDFAALAASSKPAKQGSGWLVPVVAGVALIAMLFIALNMLRKMAPSHGAAPDSSTPAASLPVAPAAPVPAAPAEEPAPAPVPMAAQPASAQEDAEFMTQFRKADELKAKGDWAGLAALAKTWSEAQPERNEPLQFLAIASSSLGNYQQSIDALRKILAREPDHASAQSLLADAYLQAQRWTEAAGIYRQMVAVKTDDARLWNNYGVALGGAGQQPQAAAALETAVRLDPGFKKAWTNLGNVYQQMGDSARASAAFANAK